MWPKMGEAPSTSCLFTTGRASLKMEKIKTHISTRERRMKYMQTHLFFLFPFFLNRDQTIAEIMLQGIPKQHMINWTG